MQKSCFFVIHIGSVGLVDLKKNLAFVLWVKIDSNNVASCVFAQDRALGGEARAKEYPVDLLRISALTAVSAVAIRTHRCDRYLVSTVGRVLIA